MGVEVIRGRYSGGAEIVEKFEAGQSILVEEGHLLVRADHGDKRTGKTIAAFAPNKWEHARYVEPSDSAS